MVLLLACTDPDVRRLDATGAPSEHVPSVLRVTVQGDGPAWVEYGEDELDRRTPSEDDGDIAVLGLATGRTYRWRAVRDGPDGRRESREATFEVPAAPADLLPLEVDVDEPEAELSFVLGSVIRPEIVSYAAIARRSGEWVWWAEAGPDRVIVTPELSPDRRAVTWVETDVAKWEDVGTLVRVELDGSARTETRLVNGHHDVVQHPDGTVAYLAMDFRERDVPTLGTVLVGTDAIDLGFEGMTDADPATRLFSVFDDLPWEQELTCEHLRSPDPHLGHPMVYEWTHSNSFAFVEEEDAYYVNAKFTDWLLKIDRASGELLWVLNGIHSDFTTPGGDPVWTSAEDTALWSHAHLTELRAGGAMVFDNADHRVPHVSRAIEVQWDEDARTASIVWSYDHPGGGHTSSLGDVRRQPGGNVLVTWSTLGSVEEVTREDQRVVWRALTPEDQRIGRLVPIADLYEP